MSRTRILYVASEINPFLQTSEVAEFIKKLPQGMQEKGMEIRILMPRFGLINERRNSFIFRNSWIREVFSLVVLDTY